MRFICYRCGKPIIRCGDFGFAMDGRLYHKRCSR